MAAAMDKVAKTIMIKHNPIPGFEGLSQHHQQLTQVHAPPGPGMMGPNLPPLNSTIGSPHKTFANVVLVDGVLKKIPRPRNAFMIFANEKRKSFQQNFTKDSNSQISTRLGDAWRNLPADVKQGYFDRAKREDMEHKRRFPNYHYAPNVSRKRKRIDTNVYKSCGPQAKQQAPYYPQPQHPIQHFEHMPRAGFPQGPRMPNGTAGPYAPVQPMMHAPGARGPAPRYRPRIGNPTRQKSKSQKREMGPGEQSTVTRILKWVPIQVINTKERGDGGVPDAEPRPTEFVTQTTHAYVPVAEMQGSRGSGVNAQPSNTATHPTQSAGQPVPSAHSLPPIQSVFDPSLHASGYPPASYNQHTAFQTQAVAAPKELPLFHHKDQATYQIPESHQQQQPQKPAHPQAQESSGEIASNKSSVADTSVASSHSTETSSCISNAMSTLLEEGENQKVTIAGKVLEEHDPAEMTKNAEGGEQTAGPSPVGEAIPNQHYAAAHPSVVCPDYAGDWNRCVPVPDQSYRPGMCSYQSAPGGWYGGYQYPTYSYPSQHLDQQYVSYAPNNGYSEMEGCPPFVYMPCRSGYATGLGWDPNTLPKQTDMYNQTMCDGKVPCEPGYPCWIPPQEIPKVPAAQAVKAPEENEAPIESSETFDGNSAVQATNTTPGEQTVAEHEPPQEASEEDNSDMDVVHVIAPSEQASSDPWKPSEAENEKSDSDERPSEDYSVAMSLAMLSRSGSNITS